LAVIIIVIAITIAAISIIIIMIVIIHYFGKWSDRSLAVILVSESDYWVKADAES